MEVTISDHESRQLLLRFHKTSLDLSSLFPAFKLSAMKCTYMYFELYYGTRRMCFVMKIWFFCFRFQLQNRCSFGSHDEFEFRCCIGNQQRINQSWAKKGESVGLPQRRTKRMESSSDWQRVSLKITYCSVSGLLNNSTALHAPTHVSFTSIFYLSLYSVINSVFRINSLITEFLVVKRYCNIIYCHQYFLLLSSFLFVVTT